MQTHVPAALARLLRRRPVSRLPELRATRRCAGTTSPILGAAEVRGHPLRVQQPGAVHLDKGHHDPGPGDAQPGAGGQPDLQRPAAAPAAAESDQLGLHPPASLACSSPRSARSCAASSTHRTRLRTRVRRTDRRPAAHPDDRRADRRPARRLGAVPGVVGCGHRNRRSRDRAGRARSHGPALRVFPEAHRGGAIGTARRPVVGARRSRDRRPPAHR